MRVHLDDRHDARSKCDLVNLFLRESELRHLALRPTRNEWALGHWEAAGRPSPRARPVIQGAVAKWLRPRHFRSAVGTPEEAV
jgi:hypothetical protein